MDTAVAAAAPAPLVSIVMPAYNAARHIAETVDSVLAQTYAHWELLVIDDGSTDDTQAIVAGYAARDKRIRYVYQANARQSRARNNGLSQAAGSYIAFLDADDLWLPTKLAVQVQALAATGADLVFSDAFIFENKAELTPNAPVMSSGKGLFTGQAGLAAFLRQNQIPMLTVLVKRAALARVSDFTEDSRFPNAEDYHLWLKLLLAGCTFYGLPDVLGAYRVHAGSISSDDRWCLKYVVAAKHDLLQKHPEQSHLLKPSLRHSVFANFEEITREQDGAFYEALASSLATLGKPGYRWVFAACKRLGTRRLALKSSYFIFNYL